mmetsp:Transcript_16182/g.31654  ORF Transcript_16182/g.31654 Transcript_16182/m.31654 type:complete len:233 (-) Transcript_16182:105-803(-)
MVVCEDTAELVQSSRLRSWHPLSFGASLACLFTTHGDVGKALFRPWICGMTEFARSVSQWLALANSSRKLRNSLCSFSLCNASLDDLRLSSLTLSTAKCASCLWPHFASSNQISSRFSCFRPLNTISLFLSFSPETIRTFSMGTSRRKAKKPNTSVLSHPNFASFLVMPSSTKTMSGVSSASRLWLQLSVTAAINETSPTPCSFLGSTFTQLHVECLRSRSVVRLIADTVTV